MEDNKERSIIIPMPEFTDETVSKNKKKLKAIGGKLKRAMSLIGMSAEKYESICEEAVKTKYFFTEFLHLVAEDEKYYLGQFSWDIDFDDAVNLYNRIIEEQNLGKKISLKIATDEFMDCVETMKYIRDHFRYYTFYYIGFGFGGSSCFGGVIPNSKRKEFSKLMNEIIDYFIMADEDIFLFSIIEREKTTYEKTAKVLCYILFIANLIPALGRLMTMFSGYEFNILHADIYLYIMSFAAIILNRLCSGKNIDFKIKKIQTVIAITAPLILFNSFYFFTEKDKGLSILYLIVMALFSIDMVRVYCKVQSVWLISLCFTVFMILPLALTIPKWIEGEYGSFTMKTIESPKGTYRADVVEKRRNENDQSTSVNVYENKDFNLLVYSICKKPKVVYREKGSIYKNLKIRWQTDSSLAVNQNIYDMN